MHEFLFQTALSQVRMLIIHRQISQICAYPVQDCFFFCDLRLRKPSPSFDDHTAAKCARDLRRVPWRLFGREEWMPTCPTLYGTSTCLHVATLRTRGSSPQASRKPSRGASMLLSRINLIIPPLTHIPSRLAPASYAGSQDRNAACHIYLNSHRRVLEHCYAAGIQRVHRRRRHQERLSRCQFSVLLYFFFNKNTFEPDSEVKSPFVLGITHPCKNWALEAVITTARSRRMHEDGPASFTMMSLHCHNECAKRRSIALNLRAVRTAMAHVSVELVAGDSNGASWLHKGDSVRDQAIDQYYASRLSGRHTIVARGGQFQTNGPTCAAFSKPPGTQEEKLIRKHGAF